MKKLSEISEAEAKEICRLAGEPFLNFSTNNDGKWELSGLEIQISTTTTLNNADTKDSFIWIRKDGTVSLWRNTGGWNGNGYQPINGLKITDYLRERGYNFQC
jgi:hypothetical protein